MPVVTIPKKVMSQFDPVDTGFYRFRIGKFKEEQSKDKQSTNWTFEFEIIGGAQEKFNEHVINVTFNSKEFGLYQLGQLVEAVTQRKISEMEEESAEVNLDSLTGKELDGEVFHETYNGRIQNRIKNFSPVGKLTESAVPFG